MKIIRLTAHRVRVFLSERDLFDMHIDSGRLSPSSPELDVFLSEVLEAVKRETGFTLDGGRVLAEATPEENGIILDLSRVPEEKEPPKLIKKDNMVFEISEFDNLAELLKNIHPQRLLNMRLYSVNGKFYVVVPKRRAPAILYEYSLKNFKSALAESEIAERGKLIAGGYKLVYMRDALKKIN